MQYTKEQWDVITAKESSMLVLAGPGTGKTTVITGRLEYLLKEKKVPQEKILVITFAKEAAEQMKERFLTRTGGKYGKVTFGTMHSVFFSILREELAFVKGGNGGVLKESEKQEILKQVIRSINLEGTATKNDPGSESGKKAVTIPTAMSAIREILEEIAGYKNDESRGESLYCDRETFVRLADRYREECDHAGKIDFDDMILLCEELFANKPSVRDKWRKRYPYILMDEAQDCSFHQMKTVKYLLGPESVVMFVGDDDQSLYRFRGAEPGWMLRFEEDYPEGAVRCLSENFRCDREIVEHSTRVIENNRGRRPKKPTSATGGAGIVNYKEYGSTIDQYREISEEIRRKMDEIQAKVGMKRNGQPFCAVLVRTNLQVLEALTALNEANVTCTCAVKVKNPLRHWAVQDVLSYLKMSIGKAAEEEWVRMLNRPYRGITRAMMAGMRENGWKFGNVESGAMSAFARRSIRELERNLSLLPGLRPAAALRFVRKGMFYDTGVVADECERKGLDDEEAFAALDELEELAGGMKSIYEILEYEKKAGEAAAFLEKRETADDAFCAVMTYHAAKGLEFDTVYLPDAAEGYAPYHRAETEEEIQEERRMFYVAMTRAKHVLSISTAATVTRKGDRTEVSRFVREMFAK